MSKMMRMKMRMMKMKIMMRSDFPFPCNHFLSLYLASKCIYLTMISFFLVNRTW